jgi:hypothetical protein
MVAKFIFAFLMSFATASLVTIVHIFYKDINYELISDAYIYAMKISWPVVFVCIIFIAPILQKLTHKLTS